VADISFGELGGSQSIPADVTPTKCGLHIIEGDAAERVEQLLAAIGGALDARGRREIRTGVIIGVIVGFILLLPNNLLGSLTDKWVGNTPPPPQIEYPQQAPEPNVVPLCPPGQRPSSGTPGDCERWWQAA
jgi:hypothetical protein